MKHPNLDDAPGHRWAPRANGRWVCLWIARRDIIGAGYRPKTQRIWPPEAWPDAVFDETVKLYCESECQRLQNDMHAWHKGRGEKARFNGTINSLIRCYQTDADSDYQELRWKSRNTYDANLKQISETVGARMLSAVKGRDVKRWFANWSDHGQHIPRASARMTMFRIILGFGASILEDEHCMRLRGILEAQRFQQGKRRQSIITVEQVNALRSLAREKGRPSIALTEALKFSLIVRPKDVLGEWVPVSEPGISSVTRDDKKWLYGFDWRAVDDKFVLTHRLSKSLRGRRAIITPNAGKTKSYRLMLYPMVMEELALMAGVSPAMLRRDMFPAAGPMVSQEATGLPYGDPTYREMWRELADELEIPKTVQARDARAGGGTDAKRKGASPEAIQQAMGHSKIDTTWVYLRDDDETTAEVARKRSANVVTNDE